MAVPHPFFDHTNQTALDTVSHNITSHNGVWTSASDHAVNTSDVLGEMFQLTSLPVPSVGSSEVNVSLWTCGTNSSQEWLLTSPVCSTRFHTLVMFVIVAIGLSLITLWTILGNVLVLVALYRFASLRTMSNCLIGNLAISDLLLAVTVLPISTGHDLLGYWVFGETACTMWLCIDVLYCTASIWGLCTVAFDRYLATVYPVWYHDQRSVKKAIGCIVFVWIFSIVISFAPFIGWRHMIPSFFSFDEKIQRYECILFTSSSYVLYSAMGSFVIPAILMTFMYIRIFVVLHTQSKGLKKKASLTTSSPPNTTNGFPTIYEPPVEAGNGVGRDMTTTTLISVTAESSSNIDEVEESDVKIDTDKLLSINDTELLSEKSLVVKSGPQDNFMISKFPGANLRSALYPSSRRSNSFAVPTDSGRRRSSGRNLLSVIDMDRRNSHNVAMQRSTSEMGTFNSGMHELRLSAASHRSKSANVLSSGEDGDSFRKQTAPRRSLPCNITAFPRNSRMTMSMKRRFELREQRATKRMLLIMACFCVCWMPFLFMYVLRSVCETCHMNHHLIAAIIWLGYVNSSLNPVLYTLFNDDFRGAFKKLMGIASPALKRKKNVRR